MVQLFPVKKKIQRIKKFLFYIPKHSEITEEIIDEFKEIVISIQNSSAKDMEKIVNYFNQEIQELIDFNMESLEDRKDRIQKIEETFAKQILENEEETLKQLIFTIEFENYKFNLLTMSDIEIFLENLKNFSEILFKMLDDEIDNASLVLPFKDTNFKMNYRRNEFSRDRTSVKRLLYSARIDNTEKQEEYLSKILK